MAGGQDRVSMDRGEYNRLRKKVESLTAEIRQKDEALERIGQWCKAYPRTVFIEPTKEGWARANEVLDAAEDCPSLTAISGSNMRHVVEGIQEVIDSATTNSGRVHD